jgi:hypothetical protein
MATISLEIPNDQIPKLKAFIDDIEPPLPEAPPRTDAEYLTIFKAYLRSLIVKNVKKNEWQQAYQNITDIQVNDV